jgi:hypothetical protein
VNALLYDFAPRDLDASRPDRLPAPARVWFVMGGINRNGDFAYLDEATEASISYWQGTLEARRGDLVLMWCVSPRSYLHSVWRALDDGFNDPYFYYYSTIRIGLPVKIPPIPFAAFARHPVFATNPAVKARFQGRGGMAISVEHYEAVCAMARAKGVSPSMLPEPPPAHPLPDVPLATERDVEVHLVEPLLRRLGFAAAEWRYQWRIRRGRGERHVPDYVLGPDGRPGEEAGVALIECKWDIPTAQARREAFVQGRSYALRLQAGVLALAARQGVWVFQSRPDGFDEDQFLFRTWPELGDPDRFAARWKRRSGSAPWRPNWRQGDGKGRGGDGRRVRTTAARGPPRPASCGADRR